MISASVIMPLCAPNAATLYVSLVGLRTCQASTTAPMLVLCNNTPEARFRQEIEENCRLLGVRFHYVDGPFSVPKTLNLGTSMTTGDYIGIATSDVIYYPRWLENIIELWEENPEYFALCNYTFDTDGGHPCARTTTTPERRIVGTAHPSSGALVLKRSNGYVWDEQFPFWELDADFLYYMEMNGLKAGYCLNSRCDHMICGIRDHIDYNLHFGITDANKEFFGAPRKRLEAKWNLPPPT